MSKLSQKIKMKDDVIKFIKMFLYLVYLCLSLTKNIQLEKILFEKVNSLTIFYSNF